MKEIEYPITSPEGKIICMCVHDENGSIRIKGKNGSLSFQEFQRQALYPSDYQKNRGKRTKR